MDQKGYLYLLQSEKDHSFYFGSTKNIEQRLLEHNAGKSVSTRSRLPWIILRIVELPTIIEARRMEQMMKSKKRRCTEDWFCTTIKEHSIG